ncbi:MAG: putative lipid II flippase FtsW [Elusimicrobiota bacterium]
MTAHSPRRRQPVDYALLALTLALLAFGFLMTYSASAILADQRFADPWYFVKRQVAWAFVGLLAMGFLSRTHYHRLREWVWPVVFLTGLVLVAVLFTAPTAKVRRWIRFGQLGFQPAEFAKLTVVLFLADYVDRKRSKLASPLQGVVIPWAVVGGLLGLIALEPDLGTPALLFAVGLVMLFVGGARPVHLAATLACAIPALVFEILRKPYRRERVLNYFSHASKTPDSGYQVGQAMLAVGSGGWLGAGLGASRLKLLYLPEPHTDFIFPILCEELGLVGALAALALFAGLLLRGLRIADRAPDLFGTLLATGLTLLVCLQAFVNAAMSIGLLPTKGLPLPFFSYGGSSLLVSLAAVGVLLNISRSGQVRRPA